MRENKKNITIVLPTVQRLPVGGYKVAYEYANQLGMNGHLVTIIHPFGGRSNNLEFWKRNLLHLLSPKENPQKLVSWFNFHHNVNIRIIPWLAGRWLPKADATLLTAWQTSAIITGAASPGRISHLVYDYEFWVTGDAKIRAKLTAALTRPHVQYLATSAAVVDMLKSMGTISVTTITPGIDHDRFRPRVPLKDRKPLTVLFPLRSEQHKGIGDMLGAAAMIRRQRPEVQIRCFGDARIAIPDWIERLGRVSDDRLADLYNESVVFVLPSRAEGWGLPAVEAMASGAAVVVTDNGGSRDFAVDGQNAIVVPPAAPMALARAVVRLLDNDDLCAQIASAGVERVSSMTWQRSGTALLSVL